MQFKGWFDESILLQNQSYAPQITIKKNSKMEKGDKSQHHQHPLCKSTTALTKKIGQNDRVNLIKNYYDWESMIYIIHIYAWASCTRFVSVASLQKPVYRIVILKYQRNDISLYIEKRLYADIRLLQKFLGRFGILRHNIGLLVR